jgi:hypothetical protein
MTWDPNTPLPSDKLRNFPGDVTTNCWPILQTMIQADHVFNNTPVLNDDSGYHTIIHMKPQVAPAAKAGYGQLFAEQTANIYPYYQYPDSASGANPKMILPTVPAAGVFQGSNGASLGGFNMTCTRTGLGKYTCAFNVTLSGTGYLTFLTPNQTLGGTDSLITCTVTSRSTTQITCEFTERVSGSNAHYDPVTFSCMIIQFPTAP